MRVDPCSKGTGAGRGPGRSGAAWLLVGVGLLAACSSSDGGAVERAKMEPVVSASADMAVAISDSPDPASVGAQVSYSVSVTNQGPDTATGGMLQFAIQGDITSLQTTAAGCTVAGQALTCQLGSLSSGQTIPVVVTGSPATPGSMLAAVAKVSANESDTNEQDNEATETTVVNGLAGVDLGTSISDDPDPVLAGSTLDYTVRWYNAGTTTATQALAQFAIPSQSNFVSFVASGTTAGETCSYNAGTNTIDCALVDMTPERAVVVTVVVQAQDVVGGSVGQTYSMTATGHIDATAELDSNEPNDVDTETTTVYLCPTDNPCLVGQVSPQRDGGYACEFVPTDGVACSVPCYAPGVCAAGACQPGAAVICPPSGSECQVNECNPSTNQCETVNVPDATPCVGSEPCTIGETCLGGRCQGGTPKQCSQDSNVCTVAVCNPSTGACETQFTALSCDDGNPCTTADQCANGTCQGGPALDCDDGNACTDDACNPASGCTHTQVSCTDGGSGGAGGEGGSTSSGGAAGASTGGGTSAGSGGAATGGSGGAGGTEPVSCAFHAPRRDPAPPVALLLCLVGAGVLRRRNEQLRARSLH